MTRHSLSGLHGRRAAALALAASLGLAAWTGLGTARADPAEDAIVAAGVASDVARGAARDTARAAGDYALAASLGDPDAEFNLATMADNGDGLVRDERAAAILYARAASHGAGRAAYDLGLLYDDGEGVPHDASLAAAWFHAAFLDGIKEAGRRGGSGAAAEDVAATTSDGAPPTLAWPSPQAAVSPQAVELVWTPGDASPGGFWVEVARLDAAGPHDVAWFPTPLSAAALTLPAGASYAWRVFDIGTGGAQYAASAWRGFTVR